MRFIEITEDVWHASPHRFDKFRIGAASGEGGHSFGYGLYFADSKGVADWYKAQFMRRFGKNVTYRVTLPETEDYLLWDKKLSEQSAKVQIVAKKAFDFITGKIEIEKRSWTDHSTDQEVTKFEWKWFRSKRLITSGRADTEQEAKLDAQSKTMKNRKTYMAMDGEAFYRGLCDGFAYKNNGFSAGRQEFQWQASKYMEERGVVGIKYYNGVGQGFNYVIFNSDNVSIAGVED